MAWDHIKKALDVSGDLADLAMFFGAVHRDPLNPTSKIRLPNPKMFPSFARKQEHNDRWDALTNKLDPMEQNAILQIFLPLLHREQEDDFVVSAALRSSDPDARKQAAKEAEMLAHLKRIADMTATAPTPPNQVLQDQHTHQMRVREAVSLILIKDPPERYIRVWAEKQAGRAFTGIADMAIWVNDERLEMFGKWLDHPVGPVNPATGKPDDAGGVLQKLQTAAVKKKEQADKRSKRWF